MSSGIDVFVYWAQSETTLSSLEENTCFNQKATICKTENDERIQKNK